MSKLVTASILLLLVSIESFSATCTFNGNGDGTSWTDGSNWSCGSEPDPGNDNVIIPAGFNVFNDGGSDYTFDGGESITINGGLNMDGKNIIIKSNGTINVSSTANITNLFALQLAENATGTIASGASFTMEELKTDDNSLLTINGVLTVKDKLENLSDAGIVGAGSINYQGSNGNFVNTGTKGIFGCFDSNVNNCSLSGSSLPIELLFFGVTVIENSVEIHWQTASETNNDYFTIERSQDLLRWKETARIDGAGNSSKLLNYSTVDSPPIVGTYYYRLKQTDFNGQFDYSHLESVHVNEIYSNLSLSQFSNEVIISGKNIDSQYFAVYNTLGHDVTSQTERTIQTSSKMVINLSYLKPGIYFIKSTTTTNKVYKQ